MTEFDEESYETAMWSLLDDLKVIQNHAIQKVEEPKQDTQDMQDIQTTLTTPCETCSGTNIFLDDSNYICADCSSIQSRYIDGGAEWRYYGTDDQRGDDPNRCGMPTNNLLPKSSLGTTIGGRWNDSSYVKKIRMYQLWNSMPYWERTLSTIFEKIATNIAFHGIPAKVLDDAKVMYKQVSEKKISRGDNREGLIASSIYYACLMNNVPRSTKEVADMFHIEPIVLTRGNAKFQSMLKLNVKCTNAQDFIARFATKLKMDFNDISICKQIATRLDEMDVITENAPTSIAAGTIYFYCQERNYDISKKLIAEACMVSDPTIIKCYKRIVKWRSLVDDILPPKLAPIALCKNKKKNET